MTRLLDQNRNNSMWPKKIKYQTCNKLEIVLPATTTKFNYARKPEYKAWNIKNTGIVTGNENYIAKDNALKERNENVKVLRFMNHAIFKECNNNVDNDVTER